MKKRDTMLIMIIMAIVFLVGCKKNIPEEVNEVNPPMVPVTVGSIEPKIDSLELDPLDLSSEQGIKDYLQGEWVCAMEYMSNIEVKMNVDKDLGIKLSFYDSFTNEPKGDYEGNILFDWIYSLPEEAPDRITLELNDDKYVEADYFFLHRTIYDGKRVMSLFLSGFENSVFDILTGNDDYDYTIEEVMLEKVTGEFSKEVARKNEGFYAVFWGHGSKYESIWLDDVEWTPPEEDDYPPIYPRPMTLYENNVMESVLYNIDQNNKFEILGDDIFKGGVYYVETDKNGIIVELISADYKKFLEESSSDGIDSELNDLIFSIINDVAEVQNYLDTGMSILLTGETTILDDEECYDVALGTNNEDSFVREIHYAVNIDTREVYKYDVLNDVWETVGED